MGGNQPFVGFNYEYKYCVLERVERSSPATSYWPDCGLTVPRASRTSSARSPWWFGKRGTTRPGAGQQRRQRGNQARVLQGRVDPDPMNSPIQLIGEDGEVADRGALLPRSATGRMSPAEARATMEEVMRIASETLGAASMFGRIDDEDEDDGIDRV